MAKPVLSCHTVFFSNPDTTGKIHEQISKNDLIEAVIAMPAKLFFGVGIPVALLILNKQSRRNER